ncbi:MAG: hypothetical protein OHK0022_21680 [Roseiflexaceae bacterium]
MDALDHGGAPPGPGQCHRQWFGRLPRADDHRVVVFAGHLSSRRRAASMLLLLYRLRGQRICYSPIDDRLPQKYTFAVNKGLGAGVRG